MIKAVNVGAGFPGVSTATLSGEGEILFLSGHCPTDINGDVVEGDFEAQVRAVFENLKATLAEAGVGFEAVAKLTTYVAHFEPSMLPIFKKVRNSYVNEACPPASALVTVPMLYDPAVLIEIDGFAVVPRQPK
ncbi:RidA family protein [Pseudomonas sp. S07E 245]|uniref:RidA family protein n=1 Tax=unclassified Pseudomonas TaxID=196821 RepID=UPI00111CEB99|nr:MULTISPECIES: RidA family protein [unclassified Pseudomonas]QDC04120.1 RidA family protein [Pseudomonas sp. SWI7]QYX54681.1 RidA family protein [Pseudomonas sp. S07E 245]